MALPAMSQLFGSARAQDQNGHVAYYDTLSPASGIQYVGKGHGGAVVGGNSITFTSSLDAQTLNQFNSYVDVEPNFTKLMLSVLHRFNRPVPAAAADLTGITSSDADFYSDFYCRGTGSLAGSTYVAAMRSDGTAHAIPNGSTPWTGIGGSGTSWCGGSTDQFGTGDFNGDRKKDSYCYHTSSATVEVALSNGSTALTATYPTTPISGAGDVWTNTFSCSGTGVTATVGDVDGDGRDDLICHNGTGGGTYNGYTWVARAYTAAEGLGFHAIEAWQVPGGTAATTFCGVSDNKFGVADFDGDGRQDVWCFDHTAGYTYVQLSRGSLSAGGFNDPYNNSIVPWLGTSGQWCSAAATTIDFGTMDFNGDGFADLYCHNKSTNAIYLIAGRGEYLPSGFVPSGQPIGGFRYVYAGAGGGTLSASFGSVCAGQFAVGDFNGDGRSDILCHNGSTTQVQYINYNSTVGASGTYRCCTSASQYRCSEPGASIPGYAHVVWGLSSASTVITSWCGSPLVFGSSL